MNEDIRTLKLSLESKSVLDIVEHLVPKLLDVQVDGHAVRLLLKELRRLNDRGQSGP